MLLEACYFREEDFPGLLERSLTNSLTGLVRDVYGYNNRRLDVAISSKPLTTLQAQRLLVRDGSPALKLERDVIVSGRCIAVETEYWLHDAIEMRVRGQTTC